MTTDKTLLIVVLLAVVLNGLGLWWGLPLTGMHAWDVDAIAPMGPLIAAKRMLVDEWWNSGYYNKYPMGQFFILMAAYAPYIGYLWVSGGLHSPSEVYPFGFTNPETALTVLSLIARAVTAAMGVGIVALVYLTARRLAGRKAALFSALTIALSPAFVFYAHTGNVDTPSLFWSAVAIFAFGRLITGACTLHNYLLLGAAVGMAAATKEQTAPLFLLVPLSVVPLHARHVDGAAPLGRAVIRGLVDGKLVGGLMVAVATFVVATHLIFNWEGNMLRFQWRLHGIHPIYGTQYPGSAREVDGGLEALQEIATVTRDAMNPALFLAGVAGLAVLPFRHRWARHFTVPLVSYVGWVGVVSPMPFFRARFVMEVILMLAFFVGPPLAALWTFGITRSRVLAAGVVLIVVYSLLYGAEVNYLLVRDTRYAAEAWLRSQVAPGATVEAFSGPTYLPRFPRHVTVHYHLDLTSAELERLPERAPDFIVISSAYSRRFDEDSADGALLARLLRGDYGYQPVRTFRRDPVISPRLIAGLSPEILVLSNHH
jgi:4-amino-4-deoxy-L-arabinose transferase-like glycosyltransferase